MPRKDNVLTQPVPLGIAALIAAAIMAVFGWGFSILDGNISELRTETTRQMDGIRQSIDSVADSSHRDSLQMTGRIDSVATEIAVTNTKLDDLIAVAKQRTR